MYVQNPKLYASKPIIDYCSIRNRWRCRRYIHRHGRVIIGRGKTPMDAFNDYCKQIKLYNRKSNNNRERYNHTASQRTHR